MLTLNKVNKTLQKYDPEVELVKGNGYFYFCGGDCSDWYTSSVYVCRLNQLSLDRWIEEYLSLKQKYGN